jgi:L-seryl-tRNA(Ser) seleniumtransferase
MSIYKELNIQPIINASGNYTILGGSKMSKQTLIDINSAAENFVQIKELQNKVYEEIARMTKNESACISNGAAAGLYLAVAAAVQKKYNKRFYYLTKKEISKCNIVMFKAHRNPYDLVISQLGLEYKEIAFPNVILSPTKEDLLETIDENTAAFLYVDTGWAPEGDMTLEDVIKITRQKEIPLIVDAAAQLPPVENLWRFSEIGADVTVFSGGKDLRGPQSSGLMVGNNGFMSIVKSLNFPTYGIGRMLKVGREELIGLYSAVKQYLNMDHDKRYYWCENEISKLGQSFCNHPLFEVERSFPNEAGQPIARAHVKIKDENISFSDIQNYMIEGDISIYIMSEKPGSFYVNPMTLYDGEMDKIIDKLKSFKN